MHEEEIILESRFGEVPTWVVEPAGAGPWPGVVVLHDANGMSTDVRNQALWLAEAGFLAAAPDLYRGGPKVRCMIRIMRDLLAGSDDAPMSAIEAARRHLVEHERGTGRVGVIGFCMGGGFALMLAVRGEYQAASVNYGGLTKEVEAALPRACPIVASYGGRDPTLRGAATKLEHMLDAHAIPHDVKEYPQSGHGFMNDHAPSEAPWLFVVLGRLSRTRYDPEANRDARLRIVSFFREHLGGASSDERRKHVGTHSAT